MRDRIIFLLGIVFIAVCGLIFSPINNLSQEPNTLCSIFNDDVFNVKSVQPTEKGVNVYWEGKLPYALKIEFITDERVWYAHSYVCGKCALESGVIRLNPLDYIESYDSTQLSITPTSASEDLNKIIYPLDSLVCGEQNNTVATNEISRVNVKLDITCEVLPDNKEWSTGRLYMVLCE